MRNKEFFDLRHAQQQLDNSVVTCGGKPVYIKLVDTGKFGNMIAYYFDINTGRNGEEPLNSLKWDFEPVSLGFSAYTEDKVEPTRYIYRVPYRMWKLGLASGNIAHRDAHQFSYHNYRYNDDELLGSQILAKTILGDYPDLNEANKLSDKHECPIAFSRSFCVEHGWLFYKWLGCPVGEITLRKPKLYEEFNYLSQVLNEAVA